jgi:hypothetical protein
MDYRHDMAFVASESVQTSNILFFSREFGCPFFLHVPIFSEKGIGYSASDFWETGKQLRTRPVALVEHEQHGL